MQIMPVFEIFEKSATYQNLPTVGTFPAAKRLILRTVAVILVAISAMIVPKFGLFINLIGAFACTALAFVLPVIMYNQMYSKDMTFKSRVLHYALMAFGITCGLISFVVSFIDIVNSFGEEKESVPEGSELLTNEGLQDDSQVTKITDG